MQETKSGRKKLCASEKLRSFEIRSSPIKTKWNSRSLPWENVFPLLCEATSRCGINEVINFQLAETNLPEKARRPAWARPSSSYITCDALEALRGHCLRFAVSRRTFGLQTFQRERICRSDKRWGFWCQSRGDAKNSSLLAFDASVKVPDKAKNSFTGQLHDSLAYPTAPTPSSCLVQTEFIARWESYRMCNWMLLFCLRKFCIMDAKSEVNHHHPDKRMRNNKSKYITRTKLVCL